MMTLPCRHTACALTAIVSFGASCGPPSPNPSPMPPFGGDVLYSVSSSDDGLSIVDPTTGVVTFVGWLDAESTGAPFAPTGNISSPVAMAVSPFDGEIYVWNNSLLGPTRGPRDRPHGLYTVDPCTGLASKAGQLVDNELATLGGIAFSPSGPGALLGFGNPSSGGDYFYDIYINGLYVRRQAVATGRIAGADFDLSGQLFAVSLDGRLMTVDHLSGNVVDIGRFDVDVGTVGSIVFDPAGSLFGTGKRSLVGGTFEHLLYAIDPVTAQVSDIGWAQGVVATVACWTECI